MVQKFKLKKNKQGKVNYLLRTGKDLVKSQMNMMTAQSIIDEGLLTKTVDLKYPIAIGDKWFFEGEIIDGKQKTQKSNSYSGIPKGEQEK